MQNTCHGCLLSNYENMSSRGSEVCMQEFLAVEVENCLTDIVKCVPEQRISGLTLSLVLVLNWL